MKTRLLAVALGCVAVLLAGPFIGGGLDGEESRFILLQLRLPRALLGARGRGYWGRWRGL